MDNTCREFITKICRRLCALTVLFKSHICVYTVNWCQHWFEYFPNAPIGVLGMVENVLAYHDKELLQHLVDLNVTTQVSF